LLASVGLDASLRANVRAAADAVSAVDHDRDGAAAELRTLAADGRLLSLSPSSESPSWSSSSSSPARAKEEAATRLAAAFESGK
jgi:hypothetical protein